MYRIVFLWTLSHRYYPKLSHHDLSHFFLLLQKTYDRWGYSNIWHISSWLTRPCFMVVVMIPEVLIIMMYPNVILIIKMISIMAILTIMMVVMYETGWNQGVSKLHSFSNSRNYASPWRHGIVEAWSLRLPALHRGVNPWGLGLSKEIGKLSNGDGLWWSFDGWVC